MKPLLRLSLLALPAHSDARRRQTGLPDALAESARDLPDGFYWPVTLRYALQMQQEAEARYNQQQQKP